MAGSETRKIHTSHDLARNMHEAADWILSRPEFSLGGAAYAKHYQYGFYCDKEMFLAAVKAIGAGRKEYTNDYVAFIADIPGGSIKIEAPRNAVCRLIEPAQYETVQSEERRLIRSAKYECEPFLSREEEAQIGGAA